MTAENLLLLFETLRKDNLGKVFTRKEIEIVALNYNFSITTQMWASGFGKLFITSKIGNKYIYQFSRVPTRITQINRFLKDYKLYLNDTGRRIIHAKRILNLK